MARNIEDAGGITVGASQTDAPISKKFAIKDRFNFLATIMLSAVSETTGITFKLKDSGDGGLTFYQVGDQSEVALTSMTVPASDIANASNQFTETSHGRETGQPVIFEAGTAAPDGLTDGTVYYIINTGTNTFKLAASYEDAIDGTVVAITDDGTGDQIFYDARYEMRMIFEDSSDQAQLPLNDTAQIVVDTGSSDSVTVDKIYIPNDQ